MTAAIASQLCEAAGEVDSLPLPRLAALCRAIGEDAEGLAGSRDESAIRTALAVLQRCEGLIGSDGVFSANEHADDLATSDLHMLLVPFTLGQLLCSCPAREGPPQRLRMVHGALAAHTRFLHRLEQYSLLGDLATRQYEQQEEEQAEAAGLDNGADASTSGSGNGGGGGSVALRVAGSAPAPQQLRGGGNVAARRQAKIDRFKREKELSAQLEGIRQRKEASKSRRQVGVD